MAAAAIRPTMTHAAQAAVRGDVRARAADGAASMNVMSSRYPANFAGPAGGEESLS